MMKTSSFGDKELCNYIGGKDNIKSCCFMESLQTNKSQFGLINQGNPCWLKLKPDLQTFCYLNKQMDQNMTQKSKDTQKSCCRDELRSDPSTTELQLVVYSVVNALIRLAVDGATIVCCFSTRVEVAQIEMKLVLGWTSSIL